MVANAIKIFLLIFLSSAIKIKTQAVINLLQHISYCHNF